MLGVYTSGISGGHINPCVTLANCVFRKFPWRKFPAYMLAQTLGAMCGAAVVYAGYRDAIEEYEGGPGKSSHFFFLPVYQPIRLLTARVGILTVPGYSDHATAGIFCTYPVSFMSTTGQFFNEVIASALLMFTIYACKDDNNIGAGKLMPLARKL